MQPTPQRRAEIDRLKPRVADWMQRHSDVLAGAIAGSWARNQATMDSDFDVVIVTTTVERYTTDETWIVDAVGEAAPVVRTQRWGALLERRVRLGSGLEVEFGFVDPRWAATDPVDDGTAQVVSDGLEIVYDPGGVLARLTR